MHLPVVGEIGAGQADLLALSPGTAAKIMTGAPVPAGADARGALRVDRPRRRPGPHRPGADARPARPARGGGRRRRRRAGLRGHRARPAPHRAARRGRPGQRAVAAAAAGRGDLHRLRAARARAPSSATTRSTTATPSCSPRPPARPARSPTGSGSCPTSRGRSSTRSTTSWSAPTWWSPAAGSPRATTTWSRRRCAPLGTVWFGPVAMQPGKPQGFGHVGEDRHADLHAAGQPGLVVHLLPAVRAPGAAQADGADAVLPARR